MEPLPEMDEESVSDEDGDEEESSKEYVEEEEPQYQSLDQFGVRCSEDAHVRRQCTCDWVPVRKLPLITQILFPKSERRRLFCGRAELGSAVFCRVTRARRGGAAFRRGWRVGPRPSVGQTASDSAGGGRRS
uniref:Uncharacterized protein n=1 Tax=Plectus sambesii TaxID=2011161 RepID=A0A914VBG2_9BILA